MPISINVIFQRDLFKIELGEMVSSNPIISPLLNYTNIYKKCSVEE